MGEIEITSLKNPKVKEARILSKRNERDQSDRFLIEGYREIFRASHANWPIQSLYICPELFLGDNEEDLIYRIAQLGGAVYVCPENVFRSFSYRDRPDGLVAIASQQHHTLELFENDSSSFFVVAEAIEKPGNLGTILRSSDAAGVDGLIVCDRCTDIYNPNVVRASVGTLFTVPFAETKGEETINWLKKRKIAIVAATPSAELNYTDADLTQPLAIVVGTEQYGLSEKWMEAADLFVKIPMLGSADSLNVAMATTLLLYEVVRQRTHHP